MQSIALYHLLRCLIKHPDYRPFLEGEKTNLINLIRHLNYCYGLKPYFLFMLLLLAGHLYYDVHSPAVQAALCQLPIYQNLASKNQCIRYQAGKAIFVCPDHTHNMVI
jgi:hypothetical protein